MDSPIRPTNGWHGDLDSVKVYPELRHQALRGAMTVLETAQDPGSVTLHIADLHAAIDNSPLGEITRQRLLEDDDRRVLAMRWEDCLLYTSPSPRDATLSRMPSSA